MSEAPITTTTRARGDAPNVRATAQYEAAGAAGMNVRALARATGFVRGAASSAGIARLPHQRQGAGPRPTSPGPACGGASVTVSEKPTHAEAGHEGARARCAVRADAAR